MGRWVVFVVARCPLSVCYRWGAIEDAGILCFGVVCLFVACR